MSNQNSWRLIVPFQREDNIHVQLQIDEVYVSLPPARRSVQEIQEGCRYIEPRRHLFERTYERIIPVINRLYPVTGNYSVTEIGELSFSIIESTLRNGILRVYSEQLNNDFINNLNSGNPVSSQETLIYPINSERPESSIFFFNTENILRGIGICGQGRISYRK